MNEINTLAKLKPCFGKIIPETDSRTKINPLVHCQGCFDG